MNYLLLSSIIGRCCIAVMMVEMAMDIMAMMAGRILTSTNRTASGVAIVFIRIAITVLMAMSFRIGGAMP